MKISVYDLAHSKGVPTAVTEAMLLMQDRIEAQAAEIERLRGALDAVWKQATTMRNASKLVSPYPNDHAKRSIWVRSLYHEGKRLHELLKPARAALGDTQ